MNFKAYLKDNALGVLNTAGIAISIAFIPGLNLSIAAGVIMVTAAVVAEQLIKHTNQFINTTDGETKKSIAEELEIKEEKRHNRIREAAKYGSLAILCFGIAATLLFSGIATVPFLSVWAAASIGQAIGATVLLTGIIMAASKIAHEIMGFIFHSGREIPLYQSKDRYGNAYKVERASSSKEVALYDKQDKTKTHIYHSQKSPDPFYHFSLFTKKKDQNHYVDGKGNVYYDVESLLSSCVTVDTPIIGPMLRN